VLKGSSIAKLAARERRESSPSVGTPTEGRGRRMSMFLRDSASRAATDSPELFEIPGLATVDPSLPTTEEQPMQRRSTKDLFQAFGNVVLTADAGHLDALIDSYQSKKLEVTYSNMIDDFNDDREHLSVMFRKALIDARKKQMVHGEHSTTGFKPKITPEDVVKMMKELGETVKLSQVVAYLQPSGYNAAVGPCVSFDDFFGWWCYYHKKVAEEECSGALTSRSQ
jgi:hypothetical protein